MRLHQRGGGGGRGRGGGGSGGRTSNEDLLQQAGPGGLASPLGVEEWFVQAHCKSGEFVRGEHSKIVLKKTDNRDATSKSLCLHSTL